MGGPPANGEPSPPAPPPPPPPAGRCHFWLRNKRRHCANTPLASSQYCGNHLPASSRRRVPCPVDPSHTVFEENLEAHVGKCPFRKQADALAAQPYYSKGINSGGGEAGVTSAAKRAAVHELTEEEFRGLVAKIRSAHAAAAVEMRESFVVTDACDKWVKGQVDRKVPYQEKHIVQQASIIGNMETFGLLPRGGAEETVAENALAVVEFGAGRGYLTQMLADCYGIKNVFLVERRSYKLKADRSLRQNEGVTLNRLRIDIEDLNLHGIEELGGAQYLAIGKHLCGPATDMTIMCCLHEQHNHTEEKGRDKHRLRGIALATCCHHLCQWKHYASSFHLPSLAANYMHLSYTYSSKICPILKIIICLNCFVENNFHFAVADKAFLSGLGITEEEFHAMTWFSSWAVDGDHGTQDSSLEVEDRETEKPDPEITGIERMIRSIPGGERSALGFMCKDIIDTGRLLWLRYKGLDADLLSYVPSTISPENHLLVAKCK